MTGDYSSPEAVSSTQNGTINIVPLYVPEAPAATTTPHLTYNNGPLLTAAQVFTIFWGSAWQQSPLNALVQNLNNFFDFILISALMDQLTEYNTQKQHIGHGSFIGTTTVTRADPGSSIADSDIQQMLNNGITNGTFPQPTANTLYFV